MLKESNKLISIPEGAVDRAMAKLRSPYEMQVICIDVTNKCDLACSNCTRLLENQEGFWDMTPENFRLALRSLADFPGIIAMIGGNPVMHPKFELLCQIIKEEIPVKRQRGLWTNNIFKYGDLAKDVFGIFNLNPHGDLRGVNSLADLRHLGWYYDGHSSHSPVLAAVKDLFDEEEMWERIAKCDVNLNWSATVVQNKGQLRAYFCEIAASFDLARGEDHGAAVADKWWRKSINEFRTQVERFCPGCGVPARIVGNLDHEEMDSYTISNADLVQKSIIKGRKTREIKSKDEVNYQEHKVTDYSELLRSYSRDSGSGEGLGASLSNARSIIEEKDAEITLPLVTVIITNYNYANTLLDALASVQNQTYPRIECIIVDDGSNDESSAVLSHIESAFPDVRVIRKGQNAGQFEAFVTGFLFSSGQFIIFLDADDILLPSCVNVHVFAHLSSRFPAGFTSGDGMQTANNSIVNGGFISVNGFVVDRPQDDSRFFRRIDQIIPNWPSPGDFPDDFTDKMHLRLDNGWRWAFSNTSGNCYRRNAIDPMLNMRFKMQTKIQADCYLNKFVALLFGAIIIDVPVFYYRLHGKNGLSQAPELLGTYFHDVEKCFEGEMIIFRNVVDRLVEEVDVWLPRLGFRRYKRALSEMQRNHMIVTDYPKLAELSHYISVRLTASAPQLEQVMGAENLESLRKEILGIRFTGSSGGA